MIEINNQTKQKINSKIIVQLAEDFLRVYKKSAWSVSLALVGLTRIKQLNRDYRGINKATDVLSFVNESDSNAAGLNAPGETIKQKYLGEIVINLAETVKTNKYKVMLGEIGLDFKKYGQKPKAGRRDNYIFYFLLIHGLLHLVGYDDATEKGRLEMMQLGKKFLAKYL